MDNFKRHEIVEINCPTTPKWHGYRALVVDERLGPLTTLLAPIGPRPDHGPGNTSWARSTFYWPTKGLERVDSVLPKKGPPAVDTLRQETLFKLLKEAIQLGLDLAPTAGDYTATGAAWHLMNEKGMI